MPRFGSPAALQVRMTEASSSPCVSFPTQASWEPCHLNRRSLFATIKRERAPPPPSCPKLSVTRASCVLSVQWQLARLSLSSLSVADEISTSRVTVVSCILKCILERTGRRVGRQLQKHVHPNKELPRNGSLLGERIGTQHTTSAPAHSHRLLESQLQLHVPPPPLLMSLHCCETANDWRAVAGSGASDVHWDGPRRLTQEQQLRKR